MESDRIVEQMLDERQARANVAAFLATIRACEGTAGDEGYRALFGYLPSRHGPCFDDFAEHPNVRASFRQTDGTLGFTTAAGAFQIIYSTWDRLRRKFALPDFSPDSQDRAAVELITERKALDDVRAGRFEVAIGKCWPVWASLPGSTYMQPKRSQEFALAAYRDAGGSVG